MTRMLHWNGHDLPPELAGLPPGDYRLEPANDAQPVALVRADESDLVLASRAVLAALDWGSTQPDEPEPGDEPLALGDDPDVSDHSIP